MNIIKNKIQSKDTIERLNLNRIQEFIFRKGEEKKVEEYLDKNTYNYYVIRDKSKVMGKFLYKLTKNEVLQYVKDYELFSLAESSANFEEHRILCGDIWISNDWNIYIAVDTDWQKSLRECENEGKYRFSYNMINDKEPNINGLKYVIDYIIYHELFDVIVEFSSYNIPVGLNNENILIWEIRNY